MNKTKAVNRLYLLTVLWVLGASVCVGRLPFAENLAMEQLMLLSQFLYFLPVAVFMAVKKIKPWEWMPFKRIGISTIAMVVLYTLLLLPLVTLLNLISMLFVQNAFADSQQELAGNHVLVNLFVMAVVPAVAEEFTYRGIYYNAFRQRGIWTAVFGSALAFGLIHMNINQFCYAFALGVAFALLLEATGSIFATMTAHFTVNGWSVLMMALMGSQQTGAAVPMETDHTGMITLMVTAICVYAVLAAVCTCLAGAVLVWIAKHCGRLPHLKWCFRRRERMPGEKRTIWTPAFAAAFVILIGFMVWVEFL